MLTFHRLIAQRYLALGTRRTSRALLRWPLVAAIVVVAEVALTQYIEHAHGIRVQQVRLQIGQILKALQPLLALLAVIITFLVALRTRLTLFTTISVFGLFLGSAALVIVLSVMSGFEGDLKRKILGTNAHITVSRSEPPFGDYEAMRTKLAHVAGVLGATPFITNEVMITSATNEQGVVIKGIDTATVAAVTDIARNTDVGDLGYLEHPEKLRTLGGPPIFHEDAIRDEEKKAPGDKDAPEAKDAPKPRDAPKPDAKVKDAKVKDAKPKDAKPKDEEGTLRFVPTDSHGKPLPEPEPLSASRRVVPGIIVGRELAKSLRVYLGDDVNIISPFGGIGPSGPMPKSKPYRVAGIFFSGMFEYDSKYTYVALPAAQKFFAMEGDVTGIELKVIDPDNTEPVVARVRELVGPGYEVQDWKDLNRSLFSALKIEKILMFVLLCFIILVAAFSIIANGTMLVMEKGREIAILKSMGASDGSILTSFMLLGLYIGVVGTVAGIIVGIFACLALSRFGLPLNPDVYYITTLPVSLNPIEIALVFVAALAIALLATLYPAWMAARLRPVDGLRDTQR